MLNRAKLVAIMNREWSALSLFDKFQLVVLATGLGWGAYAVSPELIALTEISDKLGPKVQASDVLFVRNASRDGDAISIALEKPRTERQLQYEVWMCGGVDGTRLTFFGSGYMGTEPNAVTLTSHTSDNPFDLIVNFSDGDKAFSRRESWDLYRGVKQSETTVADRYTECGAA